MSGDPTAFLTSLVHELRKLADETEWVEFKCNNENPIQIGERISALANSAALIGKSKAYMVWGIADASHDVVGTTFVPQQTKKGNELLENWLLHQMSPKLEFRFYRFQMESQWVVVLEIDSAFRHPVQFEGTEHIRVGSYTKRLKDFPEKERLLWRVFEREPFELRRAVTNLAVDRVLALLDYPAYFQLLEIPIPERHEAILDALVRDHMVIRSDAGLWDITNMGAVLLAKQLTDFGPLARKAVRVVVYKGDDVMEAEREQIGTKGYASGFEGLIQFILALLPSSEVVEKAIRKKVPLYPEIAIRELVANALIHQDFFVTGAGPMIQIFKSRMEISNPGTSLVSLDRLLDAPPQSRNEKLASFMRRVGVCEERGTGVDKVVFQTEVFQMPAPAFEKFEDAMRAVLFAPMQLTRMERTDRVWACFLHASLKRVNREFLTNSSIRERFGISEENKAMASRFIREALDDGKIKPYDEDAPPKMRKYLPYWA